MFNLVVSVVSMAVFENQKVFEGRYSLLCILVSLFLVLDWTAYQLYCTNAD